MLATDATAHSGNCAAFLKRSIEIGLGSLQGGRQSKYDSRLDGNRQCEPEDRLVHSKVLDARRIGGGESAHDIYAPSADGESRQSARDRKKDAFHQQLPNETRARGA